MSFINTQCERLAYLEAAIKKWKESMAREAWTVDWLLERISLELAEKARIERGVNQMDPDFSFYQVVF